MNRTIYKRTRIWRNRSRRRWPLFPLGDDAGLGFSATEAATHLTYHLRRIYPADPRLGHAVSKWIRQLSDNKSASQAIAAWTETPATNQTWTELTIATASLSDVTPTDTPLEDPPV